MRHFESELDSRVLTGHEGAVSSVCFSPCGTLIVSGSDDKTVRIWDVETGALRHKIAQHRNVVTSVAFSSNGRLTASTSEDSTVQLWGVKEIKEPTMLEQLEAHSKEWKGQQSGLFRKISEFGDLIELQDQTRSEDIMDKEHELEEMPMRDETHPQWDENVTHRRTYRRDGDD